VSYTVTYGKYCKEFKMTEEIVSEFHPDKQSATQCEKCGKPVCGDFNVHYKYCYNCTIAGLNDEIAEYKILGKIEKWKLILVIVFSVIGLSAGILLAASRSTIYESVAFIWIFTGIGGNFRESLSKIGSFFRFCRKKGDSFFSALGMALLTGFVGLLLKSLAGPIIPIIKIVQYVSNMKTAKLTVTNDTDIIEKLADHYSYTQYVESK